jgi:uncharacterized protein
MKSHSAPDILWIPPYRQSNGDCACATTTFHFLDKPAIAGSYRHVPSDFSYHSLPDDYTLVFNPLGPVGIVVLSKTARTVLNGFHRPRAVTDPIARQLAALGLLRPEAGDPPSGFTQQPPVLTAWLHITNRCNLACSYCYLNQSPEMMTEVTGQAALDAMFRSAKRHRFQTVKVKYAGGEPALNFPLIRALHPYARRQAGRLGLNLEEVMLSNGTALTGRSLDFLQEAGIELMISLDGLDSAHNAQRPFGNGRESAPAVIRGIEQALARKLKPHLSITVTAHNAAEIGEVVRFALDRDLSFNLNFYRDNDQARQPERLRAEEEQLIAGVRHALAVIEAQLPRHSLMAGLVDRSNFGGLHERACEAGHNYLVFDPQGRVTRCHIELEQTVTDVDADDPLAAVKGSSTGFQNLAVDEKEGCRDCQWRYWCGGGCPFLTYRATGRNDLKSPYCNVYGALFPEIVRLEGLRLLKWHSALH